VSASSPYAAENASVKERRRSRVPNARRPPGPPHRYCRRRVDGGRRAPL